MFVYRAKNFSLFQKNSCGVAETALYVSIETFWRKTFSWKRFKVFLSSRISSEEILAFYQGNFNEAVKTTLHVSVGPV